MIQKLRIYLDRSVIEAYYDTEQPQRLVQTRRFWATLGLYEVMFSSIRAEDLGRWYQTDPAAVEAMLELTRDFQSVDFTEATARLTMAYIRNRAFLPNELELAVDTALAAQERVHFLVSWEYGDKIGIRARARIDAVNFQYGFVPLEIVSPARLMGGNNEERG